PIQINGRCLGWRERDFVEWLVEQEHAFKD
ncbi:AlpA family transcriptional regulator, partial [Vibrio parahaemolyticus]